LHDLAGGFDFLSARPTVEAAIAVPALAQGFDESASFFGTAAGTVVCRIAVF
jgi:hypothetical protein